MTLVDRKIAELAEQLRGVEADLARWLAETGDGMPLRKHHTQVSRLAEQLRGMTDRISAEAGSLSRDDEVLRECRKLQRRVLEVHRIWDYFRSKLGQRYVTWYQEYLAAADEFAWECYRLGAGHLGKEAPLVFLNGDFSPFTLDRGGRFTPQQTGRSGSLEYLNFVAKLPIPVIGLPWYQIAHLADLVLVAHEVGHVVWTDLGLRDAAEAHLFAAIQDLPDPRRDAWQAWVSEVFADLYATMAAGPAYGTALADLLAADPLLLREEFPPTGPLIKHPPASLRIRLVAEALGRKGFLAEAAAITTAWEQAYGVTSPYLADAGLVVPALLDGAHAGFQGKTLHECVTFPNSLQSKADHMATAASKGQPPTHSEDVRALVAAARLAFDVEPANTRPQHLIIARIAKVLSDERRGDRERTVGLDDRAAGAKLYDLFQITEKE